MKSSFGGPTIGGSRTTKNANNQATYFTDQWNKSYAQKLAERGPRGHKAMN